MNIILAEKNLELREVMAEVLRVAGHVVYSATTLAETLRLLSEMQGIDLLVIGATVEESGDGMRFASQMPGSGFTIPYILTTGDMELINNLPPGIDRRTILEKPFTGDTLLERINNLAATHV